MHARRAVAHLEVLADQLTKQSHAVESCRMAFRALLAALNELQEAQDALEQEKP